MTIWTSGGSGQTIGALARHGVCDRNRFRPKARAARNQRRSSRYASPPPAPTGPSGSAHPCAGRRPDRRRRRFGRRGPAARADSFFTPIHATVAHNGTPLYTESPDGFACHFLGRCRPTGGREQDGPPAEEYLDLYTRVSTVCTFGDYAKVSFDLTGERLNTPNGEPDSWARWASLDDLKFDDGGRPPSCSLPQWWWNW